MPDTMLPASPRPVQDEPTPRTVPVSRRLAVVGLIGGALLNGAESIGMRLLLPRQPETGAAKLQAIADSGATYPVLVTLGTLAIPFMCVGFLALTHLLGQRAPRTGRVAVALLLTGMFGFFGMHVLSMVQVPLSQSPDLVQAGALLDRAEAHPLLGLTFLAPFLVGTALGLLVLIVGLLRTKSVPRWVSLTMLAFLVVDFALRNPGPVDAHWLWIVACIGAARAILVSPVPGVDR
ncbi:hypothetical protein [Nonomuraea africana]|uniref:DUF4386 family protein n=1 Tax=Nonomuraea africana TaxID=46171 RepID=A0ABR9K8S8_9ACTN|nr:hypothetical protein [Nonomuraea africana]MBE1558310.1 hypothetical protein [Nonomuraea africana]